MKSLNDNEIKALLGKALQNRVNNIFNKRKFNHSFTKEEITEIKQLDFFLKEVWQFKGEELLKDFFRGQYICITCSCSITVRGKELTAFYNKMIKIEDLEYSKIEYYVAKCAYLLSRKKNMEVFYAINTFRVMKTSGNLYLPERHALNVYMSSAIFMDIDLDAEAASISNKDLIDSLKDYYGELFCNLPFNFIVRSGGGLHAYYILKESIDLREKKNLELWKETMRLLYNIFKNLGSDARVLEPSRILRPINTFNRKKKYGTAKQVELIEQNNSRYSLEELYGKLQILEQGGMASIFQEVLEEELLSEEFYNPDSKFTPIDFEDDFFQDDYIRPTYRGTLVPKETSDEPITLLQTSDETTTIPTPKTQPSSKLTPKPKVLKEKENYYKGISVDYNKITSEKFFQNRDMLFFIYNRSEHTGYRNILLFFFHYNWYVHCGIKDYDTFYLKSIDLNKKFNPSLPIEEVERCCIAHFKRFSAEPRHKCIRNTTIQLALGFTEEEKQYTRGLYCDSYTEYLIKLRERKKQYSYDRYTRELEENNKLRRSEQKALVKQIFAKDRFMSYKTFYQYTGLSKASYDVYRRELQITENRQDRAKRERESYLAPFKSNPDISYEEYNTIKPCTIRTFRKYRKIYLSSSDK